jgi:hypothetical protein
MLGRQNYLLRPAETHALFAAFDLKPDPRLLNAADDANPPFAEPFFESLGAKVCDSTDVATYEGATIIHDFNDPIPDSLSGQYDIVFDGGTLEHVFHFPQGLHNAMRMVRIGGWFAGFTPGNNWFGHGFYQFSPEVYYRALSMENGFGRCAVFAVPEGFSLKWYHVTDPSRLRNRTNLINSLRTPLLVLAQKTAPTPARLRLQQSDYQAFWDRNAPELNTGKQRKDGGATRSLKASLYRMMPGFARRLATLEARRWHPEYTIRNQQVFVPLDRERLDGFIANLMAAP